MSRSKREPEMQNIPPPRTKFGDELRRQLRGRFVPLQCDYSSIELRILRKLRRQGVKVWPE